MVLTKNFDKKVVDGKLQLLFLLCLAGFVIAIYFNSRAWCLGCFVSGYLLVLKKWNSRRNVILISSILLIVSIIILSILIKVDSSLGRILIYKISATIYKEHWVFGVGYDRFKKVYMDYQAAYFAKQHYSVKELLLADNTLYAFNDYFQFIIEFGLAGLVVVACYFFVVIKSLLKFLDDHHFHLLNAIALLLLVTVSAAAGFTHILEHLSGQVLWAIAFTVIIGYIIPAPFKLTQIICYVVLVCAFCYTDSAKKIVCYPSYRRFSEAKDLASSGFKSDALMLYKNIYPELKDDGIYLACYGKEMLYSGKPWDALPLLQQAITKVSFSDDYLTLASCYDQLNNFDQAEKTYLKTIDMVPNRFRSRFELFNFYKTRGKFDKAKIVAKQIKNLPVKIPSPFIDHVKAVTAGYLN